MLLEKVSLEGKEQSEIVAKVSPVSPSKMFRIYRIIYGILNKSLLHLSL